jgi:excinuclease ABC subunit A
MRIRGCRVHNLKNVSLDIPHNQLVVITGPSGSGKSSLAFDTIFAEGQRQYLETLSVYARQFVQQLERPDVDEVEGLAPTVSIDQLAHAPNPRSTVATVTEMYDYLRLLYARLGEPACYQCGTRIWHQSPEEIIDALFELPESTKAILLAPMVRGRKGSHAELLESIRKAGFVRARIDGEVYDLDQLPALSPRKPHTIDAVIDRIVIRESARSRITDSINLALRHGSGAVIATWPHANADPQDSANWTERLFSTQFACPTCKISFTELEPRSFSFNSPYGACPDCQGLGYVISADEVAGGMAAEVNDERSVCATCHGTRLKPEARAVKIADKAIYEVAAQSVSESRQFLTQYRKQVHEGDRPIAEPILRELDRRLEFLMRVGVDYLTLDRPADTLSGGEMQRVRLATAIGSGLVGTCYVLDEPSIGLHPRDNARLIAALRDLQQQGNSVLVVEHDDAMMLAADHLIDIGPGAGLHGGQVVAQGAPAEVCGNGDSLTGQYLSGQRKIDVPTERRPPQAKAAIELSGARLHNLKNVELRIPLGLFVCVTGVSGSGKSSLINDTLVPALAKHLGLVSRRPGPFDRLSGAKQIDKLIEIDQQPIGRSPRSNPATYCGVFDEIRRVFAATREAKQLGYKAKRFSFNVSGGRCETCRGHGHKRLAMKFLPDLTVVCPTCHGARFNAQTLRIKYRDHSIADVLNLSVERAVTFFENFTNIARPLVCLQQVGLGYLALGQSATTLSGGESQRIKLATELARADTGKTLYVLDEPTTGLHFDDVRNLLAILNRLVDLGNTVVVIEHHLDVIKQADWLIDLGPEGGQRGGYLLGSGPPEAIAALTSNATGQFLSQKL